MAKVILGTTMSLDGFINDRNGDVGRLYADFTGSQDVEILQDDIQQTGAVIMGRRSYDMSNGDFTGYEFQTPIFVVTHNPPETPAKGENDKLKFLFVTEGVDSAIQRAKAAAGDKDVTIVGGASIAQQCLNKGLVDELHIDILPLLLGEGLRFFEHINAENIQLEKIKVSEVGARTQFQFRVIR